MRLIIVLMLICIAGAAFYFYAAEEDFAGKFESGLTNVQQSVRAAFSDVPAEAPNEVKIFKRQDADGNWYFSNEPPTQGEQADTHVIRTDANIIPAPQSETKDRETHK